MNFFADEMLTRFWTSVKQRLKKLLLFFVFMVLVLPVIYLFCLNWINPLGTPLMLKRYTQGYGFQYEWKELHEVSPSLKKAVIVAEDNMFCTHRGFDFKALKYVIIDTLQGKRSAGASTISMQTSKNLLLLPNRSLVRKIFEAYYTVWLELLLDKPRILELYLNIAEFGQGVYGVGKAAQYYFKVPVDRLNLHQSASLVAILPGPLYKMPQREKTKAELYKRRVKRLSAKYSVCIDR